MGLKAEQLSYFAKIIEDNTGIVYSDNNFYQLEGRLDTIARSLGLAGADDLWARSQSGVDGALKQVLLDTATNNETSFFRDKKVFSAVENHCFEQIKLNRPSALIYHFWNAACSTGQEPYSISMLLSEREAKGVKLNVSISATDFSERVIKYAQAGAYSQLEAQRGLPTNLLLKYFSKGELDTWSINADLKRRVRFSKLNLLEPWSPAFGPFDIIFCRNVLIYQSNENKKKIIAKISARLQPRAFLILGGAESMIGLSDEFEQLNIEGAIIYRKKT